MLLLERGDAATIGEVKAGLGQQDVGLDPAQLVVFAGGRMLLDTMTLRKCRIKVGAPVDRPGNKTWCGGVFWTEDWPSDSLGLLPLCTAVILNSLSSPAPLMTHVATPDCPICAA